MVDFPEPQQTTAELGEEATLTFINAEADKTAYNESTIMEEDSLYSKLEQVFFKEGEKLKRELELSRMSKVVVTAKKIKELVPDTCRACGGLVSLQESMSGAVLILQWNCTKGHFSTWTSSEVLTEKNHQKIYVNNVQLAAVILLSGNNFQKFDFLARFLDLEIISETLFYRIQKLYCFPVVQNMWSGVKTAIHHHFSSSGVTLSGDERNDSPGHAARYCVYTLMEESSKVVVDLEVVDKRETGGKSAAMEKLALSRLLRRLKDVLTIEHLVTDASTSVKALVRDLKGISSYHL